MRIGFFFFFLSNILRIIHKKNLPTAAQLLTNGLLILGYYISYGLSPDALTNNLLEFRRKCKVGVLGRK